MLFLSNKVFIQAIATLCLLSSTVTSSLANSIDWSAAHAKLVHTDLVRPYGQLANSTQELYQAIEQLCKPSTEVATNTQVFKKAQSHFKKSHIDWAKVQHITIGPMAYLERRERFQYWPDKHKVSARQLRRLLTQLDQGKELSLEQLQEKSVALQGLPILERILFNPKETLSPSHCLIAKRISENLYTIAKDNYMAWISSPVEFAKELLEPHPSLGIYPSSEVVSETFFSQLTTGLLIIEKLKLERVIAKGGKVKNHPRELEAWRSGISRDLIQQNLSSLHSLYYNGFHSVLLEKDNELAREIHHLFKEAISQIQASAPLFPLLQKKQTPQDIVLLINTLATLNKKLSKDAASVFNFSAKFNALDGD